MCITYIWWCILDILGIDCIFPVSRLLPLLESIFYILCISCTYVKNICHGVLQQDRFYNETWAHCLLFCLKEIVCSPNTIHLWKERVNESILVNDNNSFARMGRITGFVFQKMLSLSYLFLPANYTLSLSDWI